METIESSLRDFDVLNKLGQGAFGQVFRVKRKKDGKQYALKKVKIGTLKQKQRDNALNQIRILASYDGQYIIGYKEAFYDQNTAALCIVMQFAARGDILKLNETHKKARTKYKQQQIWKALVHITKGLKSLHDKKILHRDLKSANVFITADGIYKLGDLNVSKVLKKQLACTQTGTPYYASPEVWKDKPYGAKSDIWSLGCVLYEMCALRPPFNASDLQGLYKKVCAGHFQRIPFCYSNELANMIGSLLKVDPQKRPIADQILVNPIVQKKFNGQLNEETVQQFDELLKTFKYNPKDLKGLKKILPKANYQNQSRSIKKMQLQDFRNGINSAKNMRKQPNVMLSILPPIQPVVTPAIKLNIIPEMNPKPIDNGQKKLQQFLERRRQIQDEERLKKIKNLHEQKQQIQQKRDRILSACGVRQAYINYQAPKIAIQKQIQLPSQPQTTKPSRKSQNLPPSQVRLPPKPPGLNQQNNLNYRLPPKPMNNANQINPVNRSYDNDAGREKSKENLRNVGQQIVNNKKTERPQTNRIVRSSSQQRVVYPSWWG